MQGALRVGALADGHVARGYDEIVARGRATVDPLPSRLLPLRQQHVEGGMDGNAPWNPGFGLAEVQACEGLEALVEVRPAKSRGLAVTKPGEHLEGIEHAPVLKQAPVED